MLDFATEPPELAQLIAILEAYELKLVQKYLSLGVDAISFHTDFATQEGLMISPRSFRTWLKPLFARLFRPCRRPACTCSSRPTGARWTRPTI